MKVRAIWNQKVIAESDKTIIIEGNHYFPAEAVNSKYLLPSETTTHCPWKGDASYYSLNVDGLENPDAAWFYPETSELAKSIKGRIAFWKGVEIETEEN